MSFCKNNAREVLAERLSTLALVAIKAAVRANKNVFAFALYLNDSSTNN